MKSANTFNEYRSKMNKKILDSDNLVLKRLFNLDNQTYQPGILDVQTKEMLGLVSSLVLRCDDCVKYHIEKCRDAALSRAAFFEVLAVANIVGGTIVIPHSRRAVEYWDALEEKASEENKR